MTAEVKPTNCHYCGYCCAFLATVEDGRVTDLVPDPSRYPYDERILAGCRRWRMNLDALDGPDRVNYPLRRAGKRGGNEWERVSWDEALDDIAARLRALADEHGPETLASAIGGPHASFWPLHRFMNLFGSPNNMGIGQICWNPRIWMDALTFGWTVEADIVPGVTECLFIWGTNPAQSDNSAFWRSILAFARSDAALVVVDPRRTQAAAVADLWLPVRPGTDCTLALGLLHVIIGEGLVDRAFVDAWCHGFDELAEHVRPYTPAHVAAVCGLPEDDIVRAARLFGRAGAAALVSGRGVDQVGANVAPTHRAICCLRAVTGNVDKPGSCVLAEGPDFMSEMELEMSDALAPERRARCLNTPFTPLQCYDGYDRARKLTEKLGRTLPERYLTSALPHLVLRAMEEGEPYPVRALIVNATNPLLTYADTHRVFDALMGLDLLVVLDYYMTPTAMIADYVLPAAGAIERPVLQVHGGVANMGYGGPRLPEPAAPAAPLCSPELVEDAERAGGAHLPMITGSRKQPYNASMYFNNPAFRQKSPHPVAEVSEATAGRLGLKPGDRVEIATDKGSARFILETAPLRDDLVNVDYGWWHPEWEPGGPDLGGMWESNVNCLTSCEPGEPLIGTWSYNAIDCVIRRIDEPLSWE